MKRFIPSYLPIAAAALGLAPALAGETCSGFSQQSACRWP